jgi:hypothetical protein
MQLTRMAKEIRTTWLQVRMNTAEKAQLRKEARREGVNMSKLVLRRALAEPAQEHLK